MEPGLSHGCFIAQPFPAVGNRSLAVLFLWKYRFIMEGSVFRVKSEPGRGREKPAGGR
jgi:hypothetical protein